MFCGPALSQGVWSNETIIDIEPSILELPVLRGEMPYVMFPFSPPGTSFLPVTECVPAVLQCVPATRIISAPDEKKPGPVKRALTKTWAGIKKVYGGAVYVSNAIAPFAWLFTAGATGVAAMQ